MRAIASEFTNVLLADPRVNFTFANTELPKFTQLIFEQFCELSDGPCKYTGMDMKSAHAGMTLTDDELNVMLEDFKAALEHLQVPAREQRELLGILGSMRSDIVGK